MIAGLESYAAMKDSGTPWLGLVPSHWSVLPNRAVFSEVKTRDSGDEQMLSVTIKRGVIEQRQLLSDSSKKDSSRQDKSAYKLVCPGDIAYNKMRAWQGAVGVSELRGIVSPAYVVVRPVGNVVPRYFHYLLRTPAFAKEAERWSYGITSDMWSLRPEHFKLIYSCVPTEQEQVAIVQFLDHADRRIRRAIAAKQKLINLLEEQKQAIIHRAVTRGLDPDVRLKPSGVEWLGDVPEHWAVQRLKTLVHRVDQGVSPQAENQRADEKSWGVLKAGCVNRGVFRPNEHKRLPSDYHVDESLRVSEGDVLVSRASGSPALVGSTGRVPEIDLNLILSDKIFRLVFKCSVDPDFMTLVMNSNYYRLQVEQAISGAEGLANNLPVTSLRSFQFAVPKLGEQSLIVSSLRVELQGIFAASDRTEREASLLREYRIRLIADVVTGKLDVRAAAARLPDEIDSADGALDDESIAEDEIDPTESDDEAEIECVVA